MADTQITVAVSAQSVIATLGVFNVKNYGAYGDGVTDDTAALAMAASLCTAVNGKLIFPPGTYLSTNQVVVGSHCGVEFIGSTLLVGGVESWPEGDASQYPATVQSDFRGSGYFANNIGVGVSAGFVSIPSPAPGLPPGGNFSILAAFGENVHITDNFWKEGVHCAVTGYKTTAPFAGGAINGVVGEADINALNTQNWTGYLSTGLAAIGVTGQLGSQVGSTGTIAGIANFYAVTTSLDGATIGTWNGMYVAAPIVGTSTITTMYGLFIEPLTVGASAYYAIYSQGGIHHLGDLVDVERNVVVALPASSGTVQSNGQRLRLGSAVSGTAILDIGLAGGTGAWLQSTSTVSLATNFPLLLNPNGAKTITGGSLLCRSSAATEGANFGIGYTAGAGGTVTQLTSKVTPFTLNTATGQITFNNSALLSLSASSATWTCSAMASADVVIFNHVSGGTIGEYSFNVACSAGSGVITIRNLGSGSLSEAVVVNYAIIKGAQS